MSILAYFHKKARAALWGSPCHLVFMKKMICLFMAAVFVVVMMVPMETRASSGYVEGSDIGAPSLISESGTYMVDDEWDHVSSEEYYMSGVQHPVVEYFAYKDYVQYLTIDISKLWAQSGYLGYYTVLAPIDLIFNAKFNTNAGNSFSVAVHDVEFIGYNPGVTFVESVYQWSDTFDTAGTYDISQNLGSVRVTSSERINVGFDGFSNISLKIVYRVSSHTGATGVSSFAPDVQLNAAVASWGKTAFYREPLEKSWFDDLKSSIVGSLSEFKTAVDNKFTTLFTFGRQWTDDIIDAIVGQSGGSGISSAQEELDDQLNSIEQVEQQLSDQVADKIEVPSVSLNADETGGLRWVITTINSLYLSFNELHVMFACVVFFGIIAVLLFGRRNL